MFYFEKDFFLSYRILAKRMKLKISENNFEDSYSNSIQEFFVTELKKRHVLFGKLYVHFLSEHCLNSKTPLKDDYKVVQDDFRERTLQMNSLKTLFLSVHVRYGVAIYYFRRLKNNRRM